MKYKPLVSVVIPNYKKGVLLKRAVESVLKQEYDNWECIIVDNQSGGFDADYLNHISTHPKIKVLFIDNKGIIAKSRNKGILNSSDKSDFISFLDSDDWWHESKLTHIINQSLEYDIIFHKIIPVPFYYILNFPFLLLRKRLNVTLSKLIYSGNCICNSAATIRKKMILDLNLIRESKDFIAWEDYDLWLRASKKGAKFHFIPRILTYYSINNNNTKNDSADLRIANNFSKHYLSDKSFIDYPEWVIYTIFSSKIKLNLIAINNIFNTKAFFKLSIFLQFKLLINIIAHKLKSFY